MQDKKVSARLVLSLLCVAILVPLVSSVNPSGDISNQQIKSRNLQADGTPIPPMPPPKGKEVLLVDGTPIPPMPPPKLDRSAGTLIADGTPIPPMPPPKGKEVLLADGTPIPPMPPPKMDRSAGTQIADGTPIPPMPPPKGTKGRASNISA